MLSILSPERALIFRITHRDNLPWILRNGLHCKNTERADPNFTGIGNAELIERRTYRQVPAYPGGVLSDYIPFYFTPASPMLYNISTGYGGIRQRHNDEIIVLVSSLSKLQQADIPLVFTDRHAYLATASFFTDLSSLENIPWQDLQNKDFRRDNERLDKMERYQAEALAHRHVPISALLGVACCNAAATAQAANIIAAAGVNLQAATRPGWYFS